MPSRRGFGALFPPLSPSAGSAGRIHCCRPARSGNLAGSFAPGSTRALIEQYFSHHPQKNSYTLPATKRHYYRLARARANIRYALSEAPLNLLSSWRRRGEPESSGTRRGRILLRQLAEPGTQSDFPGPQSVWRPLGKAERNLDIDACYLVSWY